MEYITKKERNIKMTHYEETIVKFSDALGKIDSINDVCYQGKCYKPRYCVCGQRIKKGYLFKNKKTNTDCIVGKRCLYHIVDYLGWK